MLLDLCYFKQKKQFFFFYHRELLLGKPLEKLEEWTLGWPPRKGSLDRATRAGKRGDTSHKPLGGCQGSASGMNEF